MYHVILELSLIVVGFGSPILRLVNYTAVATSGNNFIQG